MTSILSTISGYFSKPLILGSFLPVLIFVLLSWLLLMPILPAYSFLQPLEGLEKEWKLLAISFITIVASGLIYNLNIQILRLYQGYPWRDSWIGRVRTRRFQKEYEFREARVHGLRTLLRAMDNARETKDLPLIQATIARLQENEVSLNEIDVSDKQWWQVWYEQQDYETHLNNERWDRIQESVLNEYTKILERIRQEFPKEKWLILPTRLGNIIRSFEYYPRREYGMDGSEMWPRLIAAIDKEYAVIVDDAKTSCDFFITSSMLSGILSAIFFVVAFMRPVAITGRTILFTTVGKSVIFAVLAYALYLLAIPRAEEWGRMVKSAFDLYRWKLLSQLGYKQQLSTRSAERDLWKEISRQTIYGDSFKKKAPLDYVDPSQPAIPSVVSAEPADLQLQISRGVQLVARTDKLRIILRIKNTNEKSEARKIVVTDKLPDGLYYEWDSATSDVGEVEISGSNPYQFALTGPLGANQSLTLSYQVISLTSNQAHDVGLHFSRR